MAQRPWLGGTLFFLALSIAGLTTAALLGYRGLDIYFGGLEQNIESAKQAEDLSRDMDQALLSWAFACLALLLGLGAGAVLVKGLFDDLARSRRGAVDPEDAEALL